jgi:hypothetical protein
MGRRPLPWSGGLPALLPGPPEGVGPRLVLGVDVWAGQRFSDAADVYSEAWGVLAQDLDEVGVDPAYVWGGAEVGYLVTEQNQVVFSEFEVVRYRAAVRRQVLAPGGADVEALVESVPDVLRDVVRVVLDTGRARAVREVVDGLFDRAEVLGVDLEQMALVSARAMETWFSWLEGLAMLGVDPVAARAWVSETIGEGTAPDLDKVLCLIGRPPGPLDRQAVSADLGERYVPTLGCLVAAALAVAHQGEVDVLTGLDPAW